LGFFVPIREYFGIVGVSIMLKYKRTDVVVYFTHKEMEYRRVDSCWEVYLDGMWRVSLDCESVETQYKKRIKLRNLIKRKELLVSNDNNVNSTNRESEISDIAGELISIFGITTYMDNTSNQLLEKLDTGEIEVK
jgi:hypothetical protein